MDCKVKLEDHLLLMINDAVISKDILDCPFYFDEINSLKCSCKHCSHLRICCVCNSVIHLKDWLYNSGYSEIIEKIKNKNKSLGND